jgi:hypothetical protein
MLRIAKAFCLQKFVVLVQKNTAFQIKIAWFCKKQLQLLLYIGKKKEEYLLKYLINQDLNGSKLKGVYYFSEANQ